MRSDFAFEYAPFEGGTLLRSPAGRSFKLPVSPERFRAQLDSGDEQLLQDLEQAGCLVTSGRSLEDLRAGTERPASLPDVFVDADAVWDEAAQVLRQTFDVSLATAYSASAVHLVLLESFDPDRLRALDESAAEDGRTWCPVYTSNGRAWVGPLITPGETASYSDVLTRHLTVAARDTVSSAAQALRTAGTPSAASQGERLWVASETALRLRRTLAADSTAALHSTLRHHQYEMNLDSLEVTAHAVLPLPTNWPAAYTGRHSTEDLVDQSVGLIYSVDRVRHSPSIPRSLHSYQARVSDYRVFSPYPNDDAAWGSAFDNPDAARGAALGEAAERTCGNFVQSGAVRHASTRELISEGTRCLEPGDLELFAAEQYSSPGFPFKPWEADEVIGWVEYTDLTDTKSTLAPAFATYVNWQEVLGLEDAHQFMSYPGIAAGQTYEAAVVSGIEEIIERDATMVWWLNGMRLPRVRPNEMWDVWTPALKELGQDASLLVIPNRFKIPVVAGILRNTREQFLNIGFAARPNAAAAASKAWTEALMLQEGSRDLLNEEGVWQRDVATALRNLKPWREDRRYLDSYRHDCRDVSDLMCQQQYYLDPRSHAQVSQLIDGEQTEDLSTIPALQDRSLESYLDAVSNAGYRVLAADLTTPDVAACGISVVRVIIPGLTPNTPAAFPPLGGGRVLTEPVVLGWRSEPARPTDLNYRPLPHA